MGVPLGGECGGPLGGECVGVPLVGECTICTYVSSIFLTMYVRKPLLL